jgi:hypothetical protein
MPSIYLRIFIINKAWYLGVIFQKFVILKAAQNFKNQRIALEVLYNSTELDFKKFRQNS